MVDALQRLLAALMSRVRVNALRESVVENRPAVVKSRRRGAGAVIACGNVFLMLARSGVRMFVRSRRWSEWETWCSRLLYPEVAAGCGGLRRSVVMAKLPGTSLRQLLRQQISVPAVAAGVREIYRAHQIHCTHFGAAWSHGDLHLDNILYDAASGRAFLIDFDARHAPDLPGLDRHADDLLVMLLELIARVGDEWRPLAAAVLEGYPDAGVLGCVARRLVVPRGFAKILFHTRTSGVPTMQIAARIRELREMVPRFAARCGAASKGED